MFSSVHHGFQGHGASNRFVRHPSSTLSEPEEDTAWFDGGERPLLQQPHATTREPRWLELQSNSSIILSLKTDVSPAVAYLGTHQHIRATIVCGRVLGRSSTSETSPASWTRCAKLTLDSLTSLVC